MELNKYSKTITLDATQPAAQAMFYGIGFNEQFFEITIIIRTGFENGTYILPQLLILLVSTEITSGRRMPYTDTTWTRTQTPIG